MFGDKLFKDLHLQYGTTGLGTELPQTMQESQNITEVEFNVGENFQWSYSIKKDPP